MLEAARRRLTVRLEAVDGNGLLPMRAASQVFTTAHAFRRFLQRALPRHLSTPPAADPLARADLPTPPAVPVAIRRRWPPAGPEILEATPAVLARLPVDHAVAPVPPRGGTDAAQAALGDFVATRLPRYVAERNEPEADVGSELSPYLHFGHVSVHEVLATLARREDWSPRDVAPGASGARSGWWRMSAAAEAFLDQLVTWREIGYNMCWQRPDHDRYESLPAWAQRTLAKHARDRRPWSYTPAELEAGRSHDPLWNAAQMQLVRDGRLHNYLRMLWGKKILEWSPSPREALATMIELNNRYALDGRDPNSYSGIFWVLGRYDRPWGPERPIFGHVRYMSSENTARKVRVRSYVRRYGSGHADPAPLRAAARA
jgi:deoxyribodipyrimidine photo-lyase